MPETDMIQLEICIDSVESAVASEKGGAQRVELCGSLIEGGTSPSAGMIAETRARVNIELQVMIRPRGGDFFFTEAEHAVMRREVQIAKDLGADGIVIGCLNSDGTVDGENSKALIEIARPLNVTFHRAFDMTRDPFEALETLIGLGVDRILTSGQEPTVLEGAELIAALREKAGNRVIILPGGGVTERNLEKIIALTGVSEIHIGTRQPVESGMQFRNERVFMGGELRPPEYLRLVAAATDVQTLRSKLG
ncbi:MAG: copper homeostasis protein [Verrucomicrobiales bacterium]|jgi:copper homeostasis protein